METKPCRICKKQKPLADFNKNRSRRDGFQDKCRECSHAEFKAYYQTNKSRHVEKVKQDTLLRMGEISSRIEAYKADHGCIKCGEMDHCCLDFHHVDPTTKVAAIAELVGDKRAWSLIENEMAKCVLLCASCHRKYHAGRFVL